MARFFERSPMNQTTKPEYSILLATYNESMNIQKMIRDILSDLGPNGQIILVDDDSPDKTWEIARNLEIPQLTVIRRTRTRGLASAYMRGIIESSAPIIGWMDADCSMPTSLFPKMKEMIQQQDVDIVVGSRYAEGGKDIRPSMRVMTSVFVNRIATLILNCPVKDIDSGFIMLKREVFDHVLFSPTGYGDYFIELIYKAHRKGLKIVEVGYEFHDRELGESKSAPSLFSFLWTGMGYLFRILKLRLSRVR